MSIISRNLNCLPVEVAVARDYHGMAPDVRERLSKLAEDLEVARRRVEAADKLLTGTIGEETFLFLYESA